MKSRFNVLKDIKTALHKIKIYRIIKTVYENHASENQKEALCASFWFCSLERI